MNFLYPLPSTSTHKLVSFRGISTEYPSSKKYNSRQDYNFNNFQEGVEVFLVRENIGYKSLWSHVKCINKNYEEQDFYSKDIFVLTSNLQNIGTKENYSVEHKPESSINLKAQEIDVLTKEIFVPYVDKRNGLLSVRIQLDYDKILDLGFFLNVLETAFYSGAKILLGHMGRSVVEDSDIYQLQKKYYTFGYINSDLDITIRRDCEPLTLTVSIPLNFKDIVKEMVIPEEVNNRGEVLDNPDIFTVTFSNKNFSSIISNLISIISGRSGDLDMFLYPGNKQYASFLPEAQIELLRAFADSLFALMQVIGFPIDVDSNKVTLYNFQLKRIPNESLVLVNGWIDSPELGRVFFTPAFIEQCKLNGAFFSPRIFGYLENYSELIRDGNNSNISIDEFINKYVKYPKTTLIDITEKGPDGGNLDPALVKEFKLRFNTDVEGCLTLKDVIGAVDTAVGIVYETIGITVSGGVGGVDSQGKPNIGSYYWWIGKNDVTDKDDPQTTWSKSFQIVANYKKYSQELFTTAENNKSGAEYAMKSAGEAAAIKASGGATDAYGAFTSSFYDAFGEQKGADYFSNNELMWLTPDASKGETGAPINGNMPISGSQWLYNSLGILASRFNWQEFIFSQIYCALKGSDPNNKEIAAMWSQVPARLIEYLKFLRSTEKARGWKAIQSWRDAVSGFPWDFKLSCDDGFVYAIKAIIWWMKRALTAIKAATAGAEKFNKAIEKLTLQKSRDPWIALARVFFKVTTKALFDAVFEFLNDFATPFCDPPLDQSPDNFGDPFKIKDTGARFAAGDPYLTENPEENSPEKQKMGEIINEITLGQDLEYTVDVIQLFLKDLRCILTPLESVRLLRGDPSDEALNIARNLIKAKYSKEPEDLSYLLFEKKLEEFFRILGGVVDQNLLSEIEDAYDRSESQSNYSYEEYCKDNRRQIVEDLINNKVPKELGILEQKTARRLARAKKLLEKLNNPYPDLNLIYLCDDEEDDDVQSFKNQFVGEAATNVKSMFEPVLTSFNDESTRISEQFTEKKTFFRINDTDKKQFGSVDYNLYNTNLQFNIKDLQANNEGFFTKEKTGETKYGKIKYIIKNKTALSDEQLYNLLIDQEVEKIDLPQCTGSLFESGSVDDQFYKFASDERVVYIRELDNKKIPWPSQPNKDLEFAFPFLKNETQKSRTFTDYIKDYNPKFFLHLKNKTSILAVCATQTVVKQEGIFNEFPYLIKQYDLEERQIFFRHIFYDKETDLIRVVYEAEFQPLRLTGRDPFGLTSAEKQARILNLESRKKFLGTMDLYVGHMWSEVRNNNEGNGLEVPIDFSWTETMVTSSKAFDDKFRPNVKVFSTTFVENNIALYGFTTEDTRSEQSASFKEFPTDGVRYYDSEQAVTAQKEYFRNRSNVYVLNSDFITLFAQKSSSYDIKINYANQQFLDQRREDRQEAAAADQADRASGASSENPFSTLEGGGGVPPPIQAPPANVSPTSFPFTPLNENLVYQDRAFTGNIIKSVFYEIKDQVDDIINYRLVSDAASLYKKDGIFNIEQIYDPSLKQFVQKVNIASGSPSGQSVEYKKYFSINVAKNKEIIDLLGGDEEYKVLYEKAVIGGNNTVLTSFYRSVYKKLLSSDYFRYTIPQEYPIWEQYRFKYTSDQTVLNEVGVKIGEIFYNDTLENFTNNAKEKALVMEQRKEFFDRWSRKYATFNNFNLSNNEFYKNCKYIPHYINYYMIEGRAKNEAKQTLCDDNMRDVPKTMIDDILVNVSFRVYVVDAIMKVLPFLSLMSKDELFYLYKDDFFIDLVRESVKREMHQYTSNYVFDTKNDYYQSFVRQKVIPTYEKYSSTDSVNPLKPEFISEREGDTEKQVNYFIKKEIKYAIDFIVKKQIIIPQETNDSDEHYSKIFVNYVPTGISTYPTSRWFDSSAVEINDDQVKDVVARNFMSSAYNTLAEKAGTLSTDLALAAKIFLKLRMHFARMMFNHVLAYANVACVVDVDKRSMLAATKQEIANIFFSLSTIDGNDTNFEQPSQADILSSLNKLAFSENPSLYADINDFNGWYYVKFIVQAVFDATHQITQTVAFNQDLGVRAARITNEVLAILNSTIWAVIDREVMVNLKNDFARTNNFLGYFYAKRTEDVLSPAALPWIGSEVPVTLGFWLGFAIANFFNPALKIGQDYFSGIGVGYLILDAIKEIEYTWRALQEFEQLQKMLNANAAELCDVPGKIIQVFPCSEEVQNYLIEDTKLLENGLQNYEDASLEDSNVIRDSEGNMIYTFPVIESGEVVIRELKVAIAEARESFDISWGNVVAPVPSPQPYVNGIVYLQKEEPNILLEFSRQKPNPRQAFVYNGGNPVAQRNGQIILLKKELNSDGKYEPIKYSVKGPGNEDTIVYYTIPAIPQKK